MATQIQHEALLIVVSWHILVLVIISIISLL